jgi:hypothetical protein
MRPLVCSVCVLAFRPIGSGKDSRSGLRAFLATGSRLGLVRPSHVR